MSTNSSKERPIPAGSCRELNRLLIYKEHRENPSPYAHFHQAPLVPVRIILPAPAKCSNRQGGRDDHFTKLPLYKELSEKNELHLVLKNATNEAELRTKR